MTSFLLDTSVLIRWRENSRLLSRSHATLIADIRNQVFVSTLSAAEIASKVSIGKLQVPDEPFASVMTSEGFRALPFTLDDAEVLRGLPLHHRDPFDRMLVAQAIAHDLVLLTSDEKLRAYDVRQA